MNERAIPHWPRGLTKPRAAAYVGVNIKDFDRLLNDGLMPKPKRVYHRQLWDRFALDRAFDMLDGGQPMSADREEIIEFEAGPPISEWPIVQRPLPRNQDRAVLHMYEFRAGKFLRADGCGSKTYAALANLGLAQTVGEVKPGKMPKYELTKLGLEKAKYLKEG
jgi:hypothetical protein